MAEMGWVRQLARALVKDEALADDSPRRPGSSPRSSSRMLIAACDPGSRAS